MEPANKPPNPHDILTCKTCGLTKLTSDFYARSRSKCKVCIREQAKARREEIMKRLGFRNG